MAAELITPFDYETGIPLPILPTEVLQRGDPHTNWHHSWHANSAPELQGIGGRALRHSRVQLVRDIDHNHGDREQGKLTYHDFYVGPPLPTTDEQRLALCVYSAAGHVPDKAIDLWSGDEPQVVRMSEQEKAILRTPEKPRPMNNQDEAWIIRRAFDDYQVLEQPAGSFGDFLDRRIGEFKLKRQNQANFGLHHLTYQYDPLRQFLRHVVLKQDLSHVHELKIEEFLQTPDEERKMRLGRYLIGEAVRKSTDHIRAPYKQLYRAGKFHPLMPAEVAGLVVWKLGVRPKRNQLVRENEASLMANLKVAS